MMNSKEIEYDNRGLMTWSYFFEHRIMPNAKLVDAYDIAILKSIHTRWTPIVPVVNTDAITDDVCAEVGFITEEELARRTVKLESIGLCRRMIGLW